MRLSRVYAASAFLVVRVISVHFSSYIHFRRPFLEQWPPADMPLVRSDKTSGSVVYGMTTIVRASWRLRTSLCRTSDHATAEVNLSPRTLLPVIRPLIFNLHTTRNDSVYGREDRLPHAVIPSFIAAAAATSG